MAIVDFDTECWDDPWIQQLPPFAKLLFIYLWTNPHRNISGIYMITVDTISFETGLSKDQIQGLWSVLDPKVKYDPEYSLCWVVKHARRQFLRGEKIAPKQKEGIRKHVMKFRWHAFSVGFARIYPEIFSQGEMDGLVNKTLFEGETLSKGIDTLSKGMDTLGGGGGGKGKGLSSSMNSVVKETRERPEIRLFMDFYYEEFRNKFNVVPVIEKGKDGNLVKGLLDSVPLEELKEALIKFFESEDEWVRNSGYGIGAFKSQVNKLRTGDHYGDTPMDRRARLIFGKGPKHEDRTTQKDPGPS